MERNKKEGDHKVPGNVYVRPEALTPTLSHREREKRVVNTYITAANACATR